MTSLLADWQFSVGLYQLTVKS